MKQETILPWLLWLAVIVCVITGAVVISSDANAEPVAEAKTGDVKLVIHNTPCTLKEVSNLPMHAEWHEGGKVYVGCWGGRPDIGVVIAYFVEDRTVAAVPARAFVKVTSL